jgi:hypothetical protein
MPCTFHPPWLDHSNNTWRKVQVMKLLIMQFSPASPHFIPLRFTTYLVNWKRSASSQRFVMKSAYMVIKN